MQEYTDKSPSFFFFFQIRLDQGVLFVCSKGKVRSSSSAPPEPQCLSESSLSGCHLPGPPTLVGYTSPRERLPSGWQGDGLEKVSWGRRVSKTPPWPIRMCEVTGRKYLGAMGHETGDAGFMGRNSLPLLLVPL